TAGTVIGAGLRGAVFPLAYLPWIAWSAEALRGAGVSRGDGTGDVRRASLVLGASLAMVALGGDLTILIDALVLAVALGAARTSAVRLALACAAGLAIGAVQWAPAIA